MGEKIAWSTGKPDKRKGSTFMKEGHKQCEAKSKRSGQQCKMAAMANGKCRMHGGKVNHEAISEGLKGNKNGLKSGEFESIFFSFVTDPDELALIEQARNASILALINQEIQLITVREFRMSKRIEALKAAGDFTMVSIEEERGTSRSKYKRTNTRKEVQEGTLGQIQAIEDALTRVQDKKAKLIELKHNIEKGEGPKDTSGVEKFLVALNGAAKAVWGDEKAPEVEDEDQDGEE